MSKHVGSVEVELEERRLSQGQLHPPSSPSQPLQALLPSSLGSLRPEVERRPAELF